MPSSPSDNRIQRTLCGAIGLALLAIGVFLYRNNPQAVMSASALIRAGSLLVVIWLAFPQLSVWRERLPQLALVAAAVLGVILVVRPSWGKIAGATAIIAILGSLVFRWLGTFTKRQ